MIAAVFSNPNKAITKAEMKTRATTDADNARWFLKAFSEGYAVDVQRLEPIPAEDFFLVRNGFFFVGVAAI